MAYTYRVHELPVIWNAVTRQRMGTINRVQGIGEAQLEWLIHIVRRFNFTERISLDPLEERRGRKEGLLSSMWHWVHRKTKLHLG